MRSFTCTCGNQLFFDNSICMRCKREVGWCPSCRAIVDVAVEGVGPLICACCKAPLVKCENYAAFNVCNRFVICEDRQGSQSEKSAGIFCDCCRFNRVVPDLQIEGNREKWFRLESAKRRVFYDLQMLGLPFGNEVDGVLPALVFDFKGDLIPDRQYRSMGPTQKVYTGHDNGVITINIQEADDVEREKLRVNMHEAQRTLLGHFRHEFGHYIWDVMIKGQRETDFITCFGDHENPPYGSALQDYYQNGPKADWLTNYVSAYATMHPWEDFAETFAVYLDMSSSLDTAVEGKLIPPVDPHDLDAMITAYKNLGIALNEMNRTIGILDFLPEVFAEPIHVKLRFVHELAGGRSQESGIRSQGTYASSQRSGPPRSLTPDS